MPRIRKWDRNPLAKVRPVVCIAAMVAISATAACNRSSTDAKASGSESPKTSSASGTSTARKKIDATKPVVEIDTSLGTITIRLDGARAPGTVRNFINYVNDRFYENTLVHYVDPGKLIVAGGYSTDRKPKPTGLPIRNEAHNGVKNLRGTIAMARDASLIDGATSQFFINLADAPQRDHSGDTAANYGYCVFGEVTDGLDVADKISNSPTENQGGDLSQTPSPPVIIRAIRVVQ